MRTSLRPSFIATVLAIGLTAGPAAAAPSNQSTASLRSSGVLATSAARADLLRARIVTHPARLRQRDLSGPPGPPEPRTVPARRSLPQAGRDFLFSRH